MSLFERHVGFANVFLFISLNAVKAHFGWPQARTCTDGGILFFNSTEEQLVSKNGTVKQGQSKQKRQVGEAAAGLSPDLAPF